MVVKGVECPHCKDQIWSQSVHDFVNCTCKKTFVDGGREYLRYGGSEGIRVVTIEVEDN